MVAECVGAPTTQEMESIEELIERVKRNTAAQIEQSARYERWAIEMGLAPQKSQEREPTELERLIQAWEQASASPLLPEHRGEESLLPEPRGEELPLPEPRGEELPLPEPRGEEPPLPEPREESCHSLITMVTRRVISIVSVCFTELSLSHYHADYSKPTVHLAPGQTLQEGKEVTLRCSSGGGYPGARIHWFDHNGSNLSAAAQFSFTQALDKSFNLTSELTIAQNSSSLPYNCSVINQLGEAETSSELLFLLAHRYHPCADSGGRRRTHAVLRSVCRQPTAFFHTADSPCSHPRATASEDNAALGQLTGKPAGAQPDYRGSWYVVSRGHPGRLKPPGDARPIVRHPLGAPVHGRLWNSLDSNSRRPDYRAHSALHVERLYWMRHSGAPERCDS
ncbi:UNVERIFIED_CONTAM: hypothetical protein FKN15_052791 [Acipenser sinensis]